MGNEGAYAADPAVVSAVLIEPGAAAAGEETAGELQPALEEAA